MLSCKEPGGLFAICSPGNFPLWGNFRASAGSTARDASAGKPCSAHFILETITGSSFLRNDHRSRISFVSQNKCRERRRISLFPRLPLGGRCRTNVRRKESPHLSFTHFLCKRPQRSRAEAPRLFFCRRLVLASPVQGEVPRCPKACRGSEAEGLLSPTPRRKKLPCFNLPEG